MNPITGQHNEDHLETAALYALKVLSAGEAAVFEDHFSSCVECQREVGALRPIINSFIFWPTDVLRPPASLWKRLLERISDESGAEPVSPSPQSEWAEAAAGIFCKLLSMDDEKSRVAMLVRLAPGADYPPHRHAGIEELHLLQGELRIDDKKLLPGDFIRAEAGTVDHRVWSETGCTCVLLTSTKDAILKPTI
jgi:quercetin dioxygenase-like cupin family protein